MNPGSQTSARVEWSVATVASVSNARRWGIVGLLFAPKERGLPSGLFDFGTRTGLVMEGLLIPWLLIRYGWRLTFAVVGFSALLWLVPWLLVAPRRLSGHTRSGSDSHSRFAATAPLQTQAHSSGG